MYLKRRQQAIQKKQQRIGQPRRGVAAEADNAISASTPQTSPSVPLAAIPRFTADELGTYRDAFDSPPASPSPPTEGSPLSPSERKAAQEAVAKEALLQAQRLKHLIPQRRIDQAKRVKELAANDRRKTEIERNRWRNGAVMSDQMPPQISEDFYTRLMNCGHGKAVLASTHTSPLTSSRRAL